VVQSTPQISQVMQAPQVQQQAAAQAPSQSDPPQSQSAMGSSDQNQHQTQQMQQQTQQQQVQSQNPMGMAGMNNFHQMFAFPMAQGGFPMMPQGMGQQQAGFAMPQFSPALMQQFMQQPGMQIPGMGQQPTSGGQGNAGQGQMSLMGGAPLDANQQAIMAQFNQAGQSGNQDKSQAQSAAV